VDTKGNANANGNACAYSYSHSRIVSIVKPIVRFDYLYIPQLREENKTFLVCAGFCVYK